MASSGFHRHQQHVRARFNRPHRRFGGIEHLSQTLHVHRVGNDESVELQRVAQHAGEDLGRYGGGHALRIQRGDGHVRGHHGVDSFVDRRAKRHQFQAVDALP